MEKERWRRSDGEEGMGKKGVGMREEEGRLP